MRAKNFEEVSGFLAPTKTISFYKFTTKNLYIFNYILYIMYYMYSLYVVSGIKKPDTKGVSNG